MFRQLLSGKFKRILALSIAVQFLGMCIYLIIFIRQQRLIEETVSDKFASQISYIENEMTWTAECLTDMTAEAVRFQMDASHRELDWIGKIADFKNTFSVLRTISDRDYHFFCYSADDQRFWELTTVSVSFADYFPIRQHLISHMGLAASGAWKLETIHHTEVLFYSCYYGNFSMGAWITGDELLKKSNAEGGYSVRFVPAQASGEQETGWFPFSEKRVTYPLQAPASGFLIELSIPADRQLVMLSMVQLIQLLIWLHVLVILVAFGVAINRNLLRPIRNLQSILNKYQDKQMTTPHADIGETVNDAYDIVRALGQQVDDLSVDLYKKNWKSKK